MNISSELTIAAAQRLEEKEFWKKEFLDFNEKVNFPYDRLTGKNGVSESFYSFEITDPSYNKLLAISNGSDYKLQSLLTVTVAVLLGKYSEREDIVLGTPIDGQGNEYQVLNQIIPLSLKIDINKTVKETLFHVNEKLGKAVKNQNYPLAQIVSDLKMPTREEEFALFDVGVVLENIQSASCIKDFPINVLFVFEKLTDKIEGKIFFNEGKYSRPSIGLIARQFKVITDSLWGDYTQLISQVSMISEEERSELEKEINQNELSLPANISLEGLFRNQVQQNPNKIAVTCEGNSLTFLELNERANQLAKNLRGSGVNRNDVVGICLKASIHFVVSALGILKAGAAYLPLDPNVPNERLEFILKESNTKIVISDDSLLGKGGVASVLNINEIEKQPSEEIELEGEGDYSSDRLAYVIYTSGTLGKPKGVKISHLSVINIIYGMNAAIYSKYNQALNLALISNFVFDASVQHLFGSLLLGHSLFIASESEKQDGNTLIEFFNRNKIDISDGNPIHLKLLNEGLEGMPKSSLHIKHMILGGDVLMKKDLQIFSDKNDGSINITNVYGPTECTVNATYFDVCSNALNTLNDTIPIGKPLPNYKLAILSKELQLNPKGVPGEIYISGLGVSLGYTNPILNTGAFINNFRKEEVWYKTGDRGKWLEDGAIQFLGRKDNQIKLRGYRIELNEIKNEILAHSGIKDAYVKVVGEDESTCIVAYFIEKSDLGIEELREFLKFKLPHYMIPSYFVKLETWPISSAGKINPHALPAPYAGSHHKNAQPVTETEQKLLLLWKAILGHDNISTHDNFFNIGGDSLKLIKLLNSIKTNFNVSLKLGVVYGNETIQKLGVVIEQATSVHSEESSDAYNQLEILKQSILNNL